MTQVLFQKLNGQEQTQAMRLKKDVSVKKIKIMKNEILKIILKPLSERSIADLTELINFWQNCTRQEFKYAMGLEYHLHNERV
jgi:hypothetical protein